jgi:hypothetical protein
MNRRKSGIARRKPNDQAQGQLFHPTTGGVEEGT